MKWNIGPSQFVKDTYQMLWLTSRLVEEANRIGQGLHNFVREGQFTAEFAQKKTPCHAPPERMKLIR